LVFSPPRAPPPPHPLLPALCARPLLLQVGTVDGLKPRSYWEAHGPHSITHDGKVDEQVRSMRGLVRIEGR
jgi:hypothetical protein